VTTSLTWLLLIYRVPAEPTRLRATVWRRVKALGAVYLQNAVVVLPDTTHHERRLRALGEEIVTLGGTAQVLRSTALAGAQDISAALNAARAEEYAEVVGRCTDFLTEIDTETAREKFTYAELEEQDEDLTKLTSWLGKIHARDTLGAPGRAAADAALARCVTALAVFADRVYTAEQVAEAARSRVAGVDPDLHPGLGRAGARRLRRRTAGSVMTAPEQQHLELARTPAPVRRVHAAAIPTPVAVATATGSPPTTATAVNAPTSATTLETTTRSRGSGVATADVFARDAGSHFRTSAALSPTRTATRAGGSPRSSRDCTAAPRVVSASSRQ